MSVKRCVILLAVVAFPTLCMAFGSGIRYEEHRSRRADRRVDSLFGADGNRILTDSLEDDTLSIEEKNRRFYDSLAAKSNRKGFTRFLHNLLVVPSTSGPTNQTPMAVTDEAMQYRPFAGMTIRSVEIVANDVFEKPVSYVEKATNAVHITTRRATIRRDMLFRVGDALDPELLVKNRQLLTSREYIYQADIIVTPSEGDPSGVDLKIVTHDRWTINVDGSVIGLTGRISGDIYDANLFGWGDKLKYKLSLDWRSGRYEGSLFEYSVPNIFGSFYNGRFVAGRTFWDTRYRAEINKRFILEKDYEAGVIYNNLKTRYYILYADPARWNIAEPVHFSSLDLWFGKSFRLPSIQSSIGGSEVSVLSKLRHCSNPPQSHQLMSPGR